MSTPSGTTALPAVGAAFPSILAVKLAVFEAAAASSHPFAVLRAEKDHQTRLFCTGLGSSFQVKEKGATACTCHVHARKDPSTGAFTVRTVERRHTCSITPDSPRGRLAKQKMQEKVNGLRRNAGAQLSQADGASEASETSEDDSEQLEDEEDASNASHDEPSPSTRTLSRPSLPVHRYGQVEPPKKRARLAPLVEEEAPDEELREKPTTTKTALKNDIDKMAEGPILEPPTSPASFPDPRSLILHVYAWAQQQGLIFNHFQARPTRIVFHCKPAHKLPRCSYGYVAVEGADGKWRIDAEHLSHDAELHSRAKKPLRTTGSTPPSLQSTASASFVDSRPHSSTHLSHSLRQSGSTAASTSIHAASSWSYTDGLSAFLLASLPTASPPDLAILHSFLAFAGVTALEDLASLLLLEDKTVGELVEHVKATKPLSADEACTVMSLLIELRQKAQTEAGL
ncbi:hypothetical protein JCM10213_002451 [Rhodosporidiobolus nylandii]